MIEIYAYLAVFAVRVLALSILYPAWFSSFLQTDAMLDDRTAERYPDIDFRTMRDQFVARFRVLNICVAVVGIALLSWLVSYMQNPGSYDDRVENLVHIHFYVLRRPAGAGGASAHAPSGLVHRSAIRGVWGSLSRSDRTADRSGWVFDNDGTPKVFAADAANVGDQRFGVLVSKPYSSRLEGEVSLWLFANVLFSSCWR